MFLSLLWTLDTLPQSDGSEFLQQSVGCWRTLRESNLFNVDFPDEWFLRELISKKKLGFRRRQKRQRMFAMEMLSVTWEIQRLCNTSSTNTFSSMKGEDIRTMFYRPRCGQWGGRLTRRRVMDPPNMAMSTDLDGIAASENYTEMETGTRCTCQWGALNWANPSGYHIIECTTYEFAIWMHLHPQTTIHYLICTSDKWNNRIINK